MPIGNKAILEITTDKPIKVEIQGQEILVEETLVIYDS